MFRNMKYLITIVVLLILALVGGYLSYNFYSKYQNLKKNPGAATQEETKTLTDAVGKLIELPKDETPTVATVLDKDKLKDQTFFKNAENGDKVLVYVNAKKAILYRASTNKVIDVAPVFTDDKADSSKK